MSDETAKREPNPTYAIEEFGVADAEKALSLNKVNRPIREGDIEKYHRLMTSGSWDPYSQVLFFDWDGNLIDGQHRMHAQIRYGKPVKWMVIRGVPPQAQENMDQHAKRRLADLLHFSGEKNTLILASITRAVHLALTGRYGVGRYIPSNVEILETLETHPGIRYSTEQALWFTSKSMIKVPPSVIGSAHYLIWQRSGNVEAADAFIHRLALMTGEQAGSPVLAFFRRMTEVQRNQVRVPQKDKLNMVLKTWNYVDDGTKVNKMSSGSKAKNRAFKLQQVKPWPQDKPVYEPLATGDPDEEQDEIQQEDEDGDVTSVAPEQAPDEAASA